jgi:hypothetical protein
MAVLFMRNRELQELCLLQGVSAPGFLPFQVKSLQKFSGIIPLLKILILHQLEMEGNGGLHPFDHKLCKCAVHF